MTMNKVQPIKRFLVIAEEHKVLKRAREQNHQGQLDPTDHLVQDPDQTDQEVQELDRTDQVVQEL